MRDWNAESLEDLHPLSKQRQPRKVWKHFLSPQEAWERIVDAPTRALLAALEDLTGERWTTVSRHEFPQSNGTRKAKRRAIEIHDQWYATAYLSEARASGTLCTPPDNRHHQCCKTPNHVILWIELGREGATVQTAFRPHPETNIVSIKEDSIRRAAEKYFEGRAPSEMNRTSIEKLDELLAADLNDPVVVYELAIQLALARGDTEDHPSVDRADLLLSGLAPEMRAELRGSLDWGGVSEAILCALKDGAFGEFHYALHQLENLLLASHEFHFHGDSDETVADVFKALAWVPASWGSLLSQAEVRRDKYSRFAPSVAALWARVTNAIVSAQSVHFDLNVPASPTVAAQMFGNSETLFDRTKRLLTELADSLVESMSTAALAPIGPSLSPSDQKPESELTASGALADGARAFVIDADNLEEVSERWRERQTLWIVDGPVLLVTFTGVGGDTIEGLSFEELIVAAQSGKARVSKQEIRPQPTQQTND